MSRPQRELKPDFCYHITSRCNSREFRLVRRECKEVLLFTLKKAIEKFQFKLYGLCIMSNHVHYLIEPKEPEDLPKIMHWINWYSAMCFNRILNRTGHFWEKRYFSTGFHKSDYRRALNTLRYIHANPKTAQMQVGYFYDFSNYGVYDRLNEDGITEWHPAFLALGETLSECARKYKGFCKKYQPKPKPTRQSYWGSSFLPKLNKEKAKGKGKKKSKDKKRTPWEDWDNLNMEVREVAKKFVMANCYNTEFVEQFFEEVV